MFIHQVRDSNSPAASVANLCDRAQLLVAAKPQMPPTYATWVWGGRLQLIFIRQGQGYNGPAAGITNLCHWARCQPGLYLALATAPLCTRCWVPWGLAPTPLTY